MLRYYRFMPADGSVHHPVSTVHITLTQLYTVAAHSIRLMNEPLILRAILVLTRTVPLVIHVDDDRGIIPWI
jgi:hypothetical protein